MAFIEREGESWACFLVTFAADDGLIHGYFSFRPGSGEANEDEVRTADIFIEDSEAEVHEKARGLGRPLLKENAQEIAGDWSTDATIVPSGDELDQLRSMYASYRLDQVSHFICLVDPADFEQAVDQILAGESVDFRASDKVQFAMMVVDHIERMLPLPDFDTWVRDYLANSEAYRLYTHTLHREGRLP